MRVSSRRLTLALFTVIGLTCLAPQIARAQRCPNSSLSYIIRDAKGLPIDPASADVKFEENSGSRAVGRDWRVNSDGYGFTGVPARIINLTKKTSTLETFEGCVFKTPVTLRLTFKGKTMNLKFLVPKLPDDYGGMRHFLVDSKPFQDGSFEIVLTDRGGYYSPKGWKRVLE